MYKTLDANKVITTVDILARRICERFPDAGLCKVAEELTQMARHAHIDVTALGQPNWRLRLATTGILAFGFILFGFVVTELHFSSSVSEFGTLVQIIEPAANIAIMVALGIVFIVRLERRWRRKRALTSLNSLRSMIHVIDMHQLTKDPSVLLGTIKPTPSSPKRTMNHVDVQRYLNYCSEMLALTGKFAALYAQCVQDQLVISTVNELEALSANLSRKIWQKITMLGRIVPKRRAKKATRKV